MRPVKKMSNQAKVLSATAIICALLSTCARKYYVEPYTVEYRTKSIEELRVDYRTISKMEDSNGR